MPPLTYSKPPKPALSLPRPQILCGSSRKYAAHIDEICDLYFGPALLVIWSTWPELWDQVCSLAYLDEENPSQLLYLLDELPEYALPTNLPVSQQAEMVLLPRLVEVEDLFPHLYIPEIPEIGPKRT
ncbi:hypothetical protein DSO57_1012008 [Entomophthora muscae]|uniref:Uncharacterized protein n=1 Tax=Entomophthora muscae TaxID=34485 RepID=A0ACC2UG67_9FUNG|nr:hypothetical protein DSO57_1012008 [Entomophthora muscae]